MKYSELGITKLNLISEYNFNNSSSVSRTTFYEKEKLIPLITYENIFNKISNLYKDTGVLGVFQNFTGISNIEYNNLLEILNKLINKYISIFKNIYR